MEINNKKCLYGGFIESIEISIPIGTLELDFCSIGLHRSKFKDVFREEVSNFSKMPNYLIRERKDFEGFIAPNTHLIKNKQVIEQILNFLSNYFFDCFIKEDSNVKFDIKMPSICWLSITKEESFSDKVLKTLFNKIEIGSTISYKNLAKLAGNLNASRAVGSVMRKNPICLIIPCHRVIKTTGNDIGNYTGGVEIKDWLLKYEKKTFKQKNLDLT